MKLQLLFQAGVGIRDVTVTGVQTCALPIFCVERGYDGIIVSNHGGRTLDYVPSTLEVLPEIVGAVGGRIPVLVDSGFRRDRKSTRLNSSHSQISYAVFCLKKKKLLIAVRTVYDPQPLDGLILRALALDTQPPLFLCCHAQYLNRISDALYYQSRAFPVSAQ